jgi:hypothetical protein
MNIIEATPVIKHIYGKKVLYLYDLPYWGTDGMIPLMDIYDKQLALWKAYIENRHTFTVDGIEYGNCSNGLMVYDLQTNHCSIAPWDAEVNPTWIEAETLSLTRLIAMGR